MALNLGRGGGQNIGGQEATALLGSMQQLQEQRTGDARATAAFQLKQAQEEADKLDMSMADYAKFNPGVIQGALTTMYGGGNGARGRAEQTYLEITNGPVTPQQAMNAERYKEFKEETAGMKYKDMETTRQLVSEGTEAVADSIEYSEMTESDKKLKGFKDNNSIPERTAYVDFLKEIQGKEGDPILTERLGELDKLEPTSSQWNAKLLQIQNEFNDGTIKTKGYESVQREKGESHNFMDEGNLEAYLAQSSTNKNLDPKQQEHMGRLLKVLPDMTSSEKTLLRAFFTGLEEGGGNVKDEQKALNRLDSTHAGRMLLEKIYDGKVAIEDLDVFYGTGKGPGAYMRIDGVDRPMLDTTYNKDDRHETITKGTAAQEAVYKDVKNRDMLDVQAEFEKASTESGAVTDTLARDVVAAEAEIIQNKKDEALTDLYGSQEATAYGNLELAYKEAGAKVADVAKGYDKVTESVAIDALKKYNDYLEDPANNVPTAPPWALTGDPAKFEQWFDGLKEDEQMAYVHSTDLITSVLPGNKALQDVYYPFEVTYKGKWWKPGDSEKMTIAMPIGYDPSGGGGDSTSGQDVRNFLLNVNG